MHQFFKSINIATFDVFYEEFFKILIIAKKVIIMTVREIAFALFAYTINTLTHNASIITGDILYWILAVPLILHYRSSLVKS